MIKYRFKTEEEFKKEFGERWCIQVNWNNDNLMDYLLGKEIPEDYNNIINFEVTNYYGQFKIDDWYINNNMIRLIKIIPEYNKNRILVYD